MLQKTQWTMAATALAIGVCLVTAARPAQAQVRMHLSRRVTTTTGSGIVIPPSSSQTTPTGIVIPPSSPPSTPVATSHAPAPAPVVTPPPPVVRSSQTVAPTDFGWFGGAPAFSLQPSLQGFSAGPGLLGEPRMPLGRLVDRVGPAIIGTDGPTVRKVIAHH